MKAMLVFVAIGITTLFSRPILGAALIGEGGKSCGTWVAERKGDSHVLLATWVLGYLSGRASSENSSALSTTDLNAIIAWMDNYCAANPLDYITDGTNRLHQELQKRAHIK